MKKAAHFFFLASLGRVFFAGGRVFLSLRRAPLISFRRRTQNSLLEYDNFNWPLCKIFPAIDQKITVIHCINRMLFYHRNHYMCSIYDSLVVYNVARARRHLFSYLFECEAMIRWVNRSNRLLIECNLN